MTFVPVLLVLMVVGWVVGFFGAFKLVNKLKEPWVGIADQLLMTQQAKDRRMLEMWAVINDPKNRILSVAAFGGLILFMGGGILIAILSHSLPGASA